MAFRPVNQGRRKARDYAGVINKNSSNAHALDFLLLELFSPWFHIKEHSSQVSYSIINRTT